LSTSSEGTRAYLRLPTYLRGPCRPPPEDHRAPDGTRLILYVVAVAQHGRYSGPVGVARTLKVCAIFGALAASAALTTCFIPPSDPKPGHAFPTVVALICVTLFFGGCIIPSATGVIMEVAHPDARPVASAGSVIIFQVFGYALSPLVSSMVMEIAGNMDGADEPAAALTNGTDTGAATLSPGQLQLGFRTVMGWGIFGAAGLLLAYRAAARNVPRNAMHVVSTPSHEGRGRARSDVGTVVAPVAAAPTGEEVPEAMNMNI
jgi:MFS family permease